MLSGAISQCFNCSVEYCRAMYGSVTFGFAGKSRGKIINGLLLTILSSLRYSYPLPNNHGLRLNSSAIFSDRRAPCSSRVINNMGRRFIWKSPSSAREGLRGMDSFSSGYFPIISRDLRYHSASRNVCLMTAITPSKEFGYPLSDHPPVLNSSTWETSFETDT